MSLLNYYCLMLILYVSNNFQILSKCSSQTFFPNLLLKSYQIIDCVAHQPNVSQQLLKLDFSSDCFSLNLLSHFVICTVRVYLNNLAYTVHQTICTVYHWIFILWNITCAVLCIIQTCLMYHLQCPMCHFCCSMCHFHMFNVSFALSHTLFILFNSSFLLSCASLTLLNSSLLSANCFNLTVNPYSCYAFVLCLVLLLFCWIAYTIVSLIPAPFSPFAFEKLWKNSPIWNRVQSLDFFLTVSTSFLTLCLNSNFCYENCWFCFSLSHPCF